MDGKVLVSVVHPPRGARARVLALALGLALILAALAASAAQARSHPQAANDTAEFSCAGVTYNFFGFPNMPNNTVTEIVKVGGGVNFQATFTFNGPSGSNTVPIALGPGHHSIDAYAKWNTNGIRGGRDLKGLHGIRCLPLTIHIPADRANIISGDETLVSLGGPTTGIPASLKVTLNGSDVSSQFARRPNGQYEALLTGLKPGANEITAEAPGETAAHYTIVDHLIGGPSISGPQIQPWRCKNAHPTDTQCDEASTYTYQYKSAITGQLETYEPSKPPEPAQIATTMTENGQTVPFIIRIETGYQDRDQYQIAVLFQPGKAWEAWAPQPQFIHKLLITHGARCGTEYETGTAPSITSDGVGVGVPGPSPSSSPTTALGLGFAVMSTALDNAGHNCGVVTQAESLIMAKEYLIDHYGTLRFTIGTGCSGGSLTQQQVANAYPGIYQGILPGCSFPDAWSGGQQLLDLHLAREYFEHPLNWGTGIVWTYHQIAAVIGHPNYGDAVDYTTLYDGLGEPESTCAGIETSEAYREATNPGGVRCTLADDMINVFGPQPEILWNPIEKKLGHGFAELPLDNVGVQYGRKALQEEVITPAEFVDLNSKLGGVDINFKPVKERRAAGEAALERSYKSGAVNEANNLTKVAIIDLRGPDAGSLHDAYRSWAIRERLEQAEGHFPRNHVIWFGEQPLSGSPTYTTEGLRAMNEWLDAVESDPRVMTLEEKVSQDRPTSIHDRCTNVEEVEEVSIPGVGVTCRPTLMTRFETPRMVAGEGVATDNQKCQLKPLSMADYAPIAFTEEERAALEKAFPSGVCDFSKPGIEQQNTIPWQTYQDDEHGGAVIYGGKRLGAAPKNSGEGWTSVAFLEWLN